MSDTTTSPTQLTKAGLEELEKELTDLRDVRLPAVIKRVETARSFGDLSENAEYASAKEEQELCETRIEELRSILENAVVVQNTRQHNQVGMGSQVVVSIKKQKKKMTFQIVGEFEADPTQAKISSVSPLGKALLGQKKGAVVVVSTPMGEMEYEILDIK